MSDRLPLNIYVILNDQVPVMTFPENQKSVIVHDYYYNEDVKLSFEDTAHKALDQIEAQSAHDRVYITSALPSAQCKLRLDVRELIKEITSIHEKGGCILGWLPDVSHRQGLFRAPLPAAK